MSARKEVSYLVDSNGCHICISHHWDYPKIYRNKRFYSISHFLWEKKFGTIKKGLLLCHKCDNPKCINLKHLFIGTHAENTKDMLNKSRDYHGSGHWFAKLNDDDVREIYASNEKRIKLSKDFGISLRYVYMIKAGSTRRCALK